MKLWKAFAVLLAFSAAIAVWVWWPEWQVSSYFSSGDLSRKEIFELINGMRSSVAQLIGGMILLAGLYYTAQNYKLAEHGKNTDRYTKAIEMLCHRPAQSTRTDDVMRMGAIYSLAALARDSDLLYWPSMNALSAFLSSNNFWLEIPCGFDQKIHPPPDVQAALEAIIYRPPTAEKYRYDLSGAKLKGAFGYRRKWTDKREQANFSRCYLWGTNLAEAELNGAIFKLSSCYNCDFSNSCLEGADFREVDDLNYANFEGADLKEANFSDVDLSGCAGLTAQQLSAALGNSATKLPTGVTRPTAWG